MATITNISNIIRGKKNTKTKFLLLIFQIVLGIKLNQSRFEQHNRSILMINIRGIADKLTKKDDQTEQLIDLNL